MPAPAPDGPTWRDLLEQWARIEADLQDVGIDVEDEHLMSSRTWRWLRIRIVGLLSNDSRLNRALMTPREAPVGAAPR